MFLHITQFGQQAAVQLLGLDLSEHDLDTKVDGGRNPEIIERLTGVAPSAELAARFHDAKEGRYRDLARGQLQPVAGLSDYLSGLRELGIPAVIVTSSDHVNTDFALGALEVAHFFAGRVTGDSVTRGKPDPQPYVMGAELLGLRGSDCLAHEDAVNGVRSAVGAGCRVLALSTTQTEGALLAAGAARVEPDFSGWREWLHL